MNYSETTRADLLSARKTAVETIEHIDWVLGFLFPSSPVKPEANGTAAESRSPSFAEHLRRALTPAENDERATMSEIMDILLLRGVIKDKERNTYNQVHVTLARANWAVRDGRGVYVITSQRHAPQESTIIPEPPGELIGQEDK